jgi:hypothetical protein
MMDILTHPPYPDPEVYSWLQCCWASGGLARVCLGPLRDRPQVDVMKVNVLVQCVLIMLVIGWPGLN